MYPSLLYHRSSFYISQIQTVLPRRKDDACVIDLLANLQYGYRSNMCYVRSILLKHKQTLTCTLPFLKTKILKTDTETFRGMLRAEEKPHELRLKSIGR
jgi:hypothetical protein